MKEVTVPLFAHSPSVSTELIERLHQIAVTRGFPVEFGSPSLFGHQTIQQRADRHLTINEKNVCAKIVDVRFDKDAGMVYGVIQPHGPKSKLIKQLIERGQEERIVLGIRRHTTATENEIVGFDLVRF